MGEETDLACLIVNPASPKLAIAGQVGSGKSTVSRLVAALTGWDRFSTGELFRRMAAERGMTPLQLNVYAREHPDIDDEVDGRLAALSDEPNPMVIDSRMAWHFVPASFKVYLTVDHRVGAERVFAAAREDERYQSIEEAAAKSAAREHEELERYLMLYGVDNSRWRNYHLVIDTTHCPPEEVVERILGALAEGERPQDDPRCLLAPRRLLPSGDVTDAGGLRVAVAEGHPVVFQGHAAVAEALVADDALAESRLAGFEAEPLGSHPTTVEWARTNVTAARVAAWEQKHDLRFASLPSWLGGS